MSHIRFHNVTCSGDGVTPLFPPLSNSVSNELVGLVGANGSGKSTLLAAVANQRNVASGSITVEGKVGFMQQARHTADVKIASVLGLERHNSLVQRIEEGLADNSDFEIVDWEFPARVEQAMKDVGLSDMSFQTSFGSLSGGERARVKLAAIFTQKPDILLLDEPTNDLDSAGRNFLSDLLESWRGPALIASHDRALLERMDRIIELSSTSIVAVSGGWSDFEIQREERLELAERNLSLAQSKTKKAKADNQARIERQAKRAKQGRKSAARTGATKLEVNAQKSRAQKSGTRNQSLGEGQIFEAENELDTAKAQLEPLLPIDVSLPLSHLQHGHVLVDAKAITCRYKLDLIFGPLDLRIAGPERIELAGPNGCGKSSLIKTIAGIQQPSEGTVEVDQLTAAILDQHLLMLEPNETLLEAIRRNIPGLDHHKSHAALARFGFRGKWSERVVGSLSGGERVRLALSCLFSRPKPPQLLLLDEPTNHLDIRATQLLEKALQNYDGAIVCVSHDRSFVEALNVDRIVDLTS